MSKNTYRSRISLSLLRNEGPASFPFDRQTTRWYSLSAGICMKTSCRYENPDVSVFYLKGLDL